MTINHLTKRLTPRLSLAAHVAVAAVLLAVAVATAAVPAVYADSPCSYSRWNYRTGTDSSGRPIYVSGGCTCYVVERLGRDVPWDGNAGAWFDNATWPRDPDRPVPGAIAAYKYAGDSGHVAYVERLTLRDHLSPVVQTDSELQGYRYQWRQVGWWWSLVRVPIYRSLETREVTEVYVVDATQKDFGSGDRIRSSSWTATRTYLERDGRRWNERWSTPRTGDATSLQGYIYRQ